MKNRTLFCLWAILFFLTAGLGFVREGAGSFQSLLTCLALGFFVPPGVLLWRSLRSGNSRTRLLIRWLSGGSLAFTALLLVANFLSVLASPGLGLFLNTVLGIVSAPMFCSGSWALSLFLWACLLFATFKK